MNRGGEKVDKDKHEVLVLFPGGNTGELDEGFKRLFMDWVKFFRDNLKCSCGLCPAECIKQCPLDRDCPEIDRVWGLWLDTLEPEDRSLVD